RSNYRHCTEGILELASSPFRCRLGVSQQPERTNMDRNATRTDFPILAGIFLGLGLGGFFDGIVLHQILQWHHMLTSAGYPITTVANLNLNTLADGLFHAATYLFTLIGLSVLWRASTRSGVTWSARVLIGATLF